MREQDVMVTTKYGRQPCFAACPDEPGAYPAIILYMDAPGFREELRDQARRIAKHGYFCLLPDLYYRLGTLRFVAAFAAYQSSRIAIRRQHRHRQARFAAFAVGSYRKRAVVWLCGSRPVGSGKRRLGVASCA